MKSNDKDYKIYITEMNALISVSEEVYYQYYRPIWKVRKRMQRAEKCFCKQKDLYKCNGICIDCKHYSRDTLSLDFEIENVGDRIADLSPSPNDIFTDKTTLELLLKRLSEIYPDAIKIGELKEEGLNERQIAEKIGTPRKTFVYRLDKAKKQLISEFGEEIKKYF